LLAVPIVTLPVIVRYAIVSPLFSYASEVICRVRVKEKALLH
jgi:hypothetical protein